MKQEGKCGDFFVNEKELIDKSKVMLGLIDDQLKIWDEQIQATRKCVVLLLAIIKENTLEIL